jgi:hypothetical protein
VDEEVLTVPHEGLTVRHRDRYGNRPTSVEGVFEDLEGLVELVLGLGEPLPGCTRTFPLRFVFEERSDLLHGLGFVHVDKLHQAGRCTPICVVWTRKALANVVKGKIVHDLGAGDLELSRELLILGAREVYAIDKEPRPKPRPWPKHLHYKQDYFANINRRLDIAFLSWPINHDVNLFPLVTTAGIVAYLGKNTDGSMCGTPRLFEVMVRRELLAYVPDGTTASSSWASSSGPDGRRSQSS